MSTEIPQPSEIEKFEEQFRSSLGKAVDLLETQGSEGYVALDPLLFEIGETTVDEMSYKEKGAIGRAVWDYFGLPTGRTFLTNRVRTYTSQSKIHEEINVRVYPTSIEDVFVHELVFKDGQKRFVIGREEVEI